MTTGMSAPPMGSTKSTPRRRPTPPIARNTLNCEGSTITQISAAMAEKKARTFVTFCPG